MAIKLFASCPIQLGSQSLDIDIYPEGGDGTPSYTSLGVNLYLSIECILRSSFDHHSFLIFPSSHQLQELYLRR